PTPELVGQANMSAAMHGALIQGMIRNASQWFAAVPSLHGAYPVLMLLLFPFKKSRLALASIALYAAAMWTATVVLNQHYIIDLLAGALLAVVAWRVEAALSHRTGR
ncbi:MAG: phosphatase PAP2 family protein, partial [Blastocatellia bacterium]